MGKYFKWAILLLIWGMFLVLIGTFGGQPGAEAAGIAGGFTAFGLWLLWLLSVARR